MPNLPEPGPVRLAAMLKCAERELAMRRATYPRLVERKGMKEEDANREIVLMRDIVEFLKDAIAGD
jgi:hypothetical protein